MDPEERKSKVQHPLYLLYKQIYKGPNYDTPDFCYKKLEKDSPDVEEVWAELCYNEENQLVGGATAKVSVA